MWNHESMAKNSLIFITGGRRSGKSSHALTLAESLGERRLYIATAQALDDEMAERIARHRKERSHGWDTAEEPLNVAEVIKGTGNYDVVLLDCLTLWLCNAMHRADAEFGEDPRIPSVSMSGNGGREKRRPGGAADDALIQQIEGLVDACQISGAANLVVVSNETGSGIIPDNALSRRFSDLAGLMNQRMAAAAGRVILTVAGIPVTIKG